MYEMLKEIELQYWSFMKLAVGHYTFLFALCPTTKKMVFYTKIYISVSHNQFHESDIDKFLYGLQTLCKD